MTTADDLDLASDNPRALRGEERTTADDIRSVCDEIKVMLLLKNQAYGDSATSPLRVFSRASAEEAILVRIDDKLSRIARGQEFGGDDTVLDLVGYLVLLRVLRIQQKRAAK